MSGNVPNSFPANDSRSGLPPHDFSQAFYDLAEYAYLRHPLHPKVTLGERRRLHYDHILDVGDMAIAIAARQTRTAKFGQGPVQDLLARVMLPDHRQDDAMNPPDMHECWLDSPIILVDLGPCSANRFTSERFVAHEDKRFSEQYQLITQNIDLSQAVVIDGYQRLRQASRRALLNGEPQMLNYISISMWEALRYVPTIASRERRKHTHEQIASLFREDPENPPAETLHRYLPAARENVHKDRGVKAVPLSRQKMIIGSITAPSARGRPKADVVLSALFLEIKLEFRRASIFRDLLKAERSRWNKSVEPQNVKSQGKLTPARLYDRITDPVIEPIRKQNLTRSRLTEKKALKDKSKTDRRQYREKIGVMGLDAFLDQITSQTYVEGGFRDAEEFNQICTTMFGRAKAQGGISGAAELVEKSIETAARLFRVYFRIKCLSSPAVREILGLKQSKESFSRDDSKAMQDYRNAYTYPVEGVVGKNTKIHVKDVFSISATIGYNICDFYPEYCVVADIVDALVDVLAQANDKSGKPSRTRRAFASAFTFACYGVSHYVRNPDRWQAWIDFEVQARLRGVSFDEAVEIYAKIYRELMPEQHTRNGFNFAKERLTQFPM